MRISLPLMHPSSPSLLQKRRSWIPNLGCFLKPHTELLKMVWAPSNSDATLITLYLAGIPMDKISYSRTSVFSGSLSTDYADTNKWDLENGSKHSLMGTNSLLSGRLSWFFNLLGPNLTLDTACSSSLVALDLGCQSLLSGSADMVTRFCIKIHKVLIH